MADDRVLTSFSLNVDNGEITRTRALGDKVIEQKKVAHYDVESLTLTFPSALYLKLYKLGCITYLSENEMTIRSFQRNDLDLDAPLTKSIPPRPKKNKLEGDKTPEVVQWYYDYRPNEFRTRYGFLGHYTGKVRMKVPVWEERPVDKEPEFRGEEWQEFTVKNVIVADRAVAGVEGKRLTYLPDECVDWDESEDDVEEGRVAETTRRLPGGRKHESDDDEAEADMRSPRGAGKGGE